MRVEAQPIVAGYHEMTKGCWTLLPLSTHYQIVKPREHQIQHVFRVFITNPNKR